MPEKSELAEKYPTFSEDIYGEASIAAPYGHYRALRALGPVVYLPAQDVLVVSRYKDVKAALLDHRTFTSGEGIALNGIANAIGRGTMIASDPPIHSTLRGIMGAPLLPKAVAELKSQVATAAQDLVRRLASRGNFDGVADFARYLPVSIVSTLVGLPEAGRENMLDWAAAAFDSLGPENGRFSRAMPKLQQMLDYILHSAGPTDVTPGSWAARIYEAAEAGMIAREQVPALLLDYLAPSLDTTIFATAHLLHQLGCQPEQWRLLKNDRSLIANAIEEVIRFEPALRGFARVTSDAIVIDGTIVPASSRVLLLYASANRDEDKFDDPDVFDVTRADAKDHLGFGKGRHACAGQHLARLEMQCLLEALVEEIAEINVGDPTIQSNNILRGFASLPVEVRRHEA